MPHAKGGGFGDTAKRQNVAPDPGELLKLQALQGDAGLAPRDGDGEQKSPEELYNKEVPEVDALHRKPDPEKAVPLGAIVGGPKMSVVPDQTQVISPDDRGINA